MKRIAAYAVALIAVFAVLAEISSAQVATGTPPFGSFGGGPFDVVNLGNLNVHFSVPIRHKAGRGTPFASDLPYESSIWTPVSYNGGASWNPATNWGWALVSGATSTGTTGYFTTQSSVGFCYTYPNPYPTGSVTGTSFTYTDVGGINHSFSGYVTQYSGTCTGTPITTFTSTATDGSGLTICIGCSSGSYIATPQGTLIYPPSNPTPTTAQPTITIDANGNKITSDTNGNYTDTLGTQALVIAGSPATSSFPNNVVNLGYVAPSGATATYTVSYLPHTVTTLFQCTGVTDYNQANIYLVDKITRPDGTFYQFTYENTPGSQTTVTGRIGKVTLPTGGSIQYQYTGTHGGIICADGSTAGLTRTITPGAPAPVSTWTYSRWQDVSPNLSHWRTTITDPTAAGNQTLLDFQKDGSNSNNFYETQRKGYSGAVGGTLLRTVLTCWNATTNPTPASPCATTATSSPILRKTIFTELPDTTGVISESDFQYGSFSNPMPDGFPTEVDSYDWGTKGSGAVSAAPIRKIVTTYLQLGGSNGIFPTSVKIEDSNNIVKASTTYSYDETTPTATTGTPQLVSITGSRANLTTIATQVSGSVTLYRKFTYYDTGTLRTSTDSGLTSGGGTNITTYNYDNSGTPPHACGNSFVTSIFEPLSLQRSMTWDCNGGVLTSATDENGKTATVSYTGTGADAFYWRPYQAQDQLASPNTTTFSYPSASATESSMLFNSSTSVADFRSKRDGFGRSIVGQTKQGPSATNYDSVEADYDVAGRIAKVYRPYSAASDTLCSGTCPGTTTTYDAVGRFYVVTDGGGGTVTSTYPYNDVLQVVGPAPTGEHTKQKQLEYNGLGWLTSVCEITTGTGTGACGQNSAQTGFLTQYTYDLLGNMTGVTQNAQPGNSGTQTRTYTFDMIGRTNSELNPETGTTSITYVYDSWDASCGTYTSAGDQVEKKDAMGNVTCFKYDALHRTTDVTYPSGNYAAATAPKHYVYDSATVNGTAMSNPKGRLAEAYTGTSGSKTTDLGFSYSARGEVTDVWESTPNSAGYYHVTSQYWANRKLNTLSGLPGLTTMTYAADAEGRTSTVSAASGQNPVTATSYNVARQVTGVTFGSADTDAYQYDSNTGRMTQYKFNMGTGPQTDTGALTWNTNGTLGQLQITDQINTANSQTCTFGHDDLVRITSANCGSVWAQTFGFDPFGNLSKSGSASFLPTYNLAKNQYSSIPGGTVTYDANGNLTNDVTHSYTWDAEGNNLSVDGSTVTMIYDALERMIEQTRGSAHQQIVYGPDGMKLALMNGQTLVNAFVALPGGDTGVYSSSGLAYYRHSDHLGSSRLSATTTRTKYYDVAYAPYGEDYNGSGTTADLAFTDQNQDTAKNGWSTNLYDFMFREYRTAHGRWTSPDPAGLSAVDPSNPQSWNRYGYALNSPTWLVDPLGLQDTCFNTSQPMYEQSISTIHYPDGSSSTQYGTPVYTGMQAVTICFGYIPDSNSWAWNYTKSFFGGFSLFGPKNDPRPSCFGTFLSDSAKNAAGLPNIDITGAAAATDYALASRYATQAAPSSRALRGGLSAKQWVARDGAKQLAKSAAVGILTNVDLAMGQALIDEAGAALAGNCK